MPAIGFNAAFTRCIKFDPGLLVPIYRKSLIKLFFDNRTNSIIRRSKSRWLGIIRRILKSKFYGKSYPFIRFFSDTTTIGAMMEPGSGQPGLTQGPDPFDPVAWPAWMTQFWPGQPDLTWGPDPVDPVDWPGWPGRLTQFPSYHPIIIFKLPLHASNFKQMMYTLTQKERRGIWQRPLNQEFSLSFAHIKRAI